MTLLEQIATAALAALNTGRPAGVPEAKRWSGITVEVADLPARTLVYLDESVERAGAPTSPLVRRRATIAVQDLVAGTGTDVSGLSPQQVAETYRAWSIKALVANRFSNLAIDTVEQSTSWTLEQGEVPLVRMTQQFEITFTTRANDAEQRA